MPIGIRPRQQLPQTGFNQIVLVVSHKHNLAHTHTLFQRSITTPARFEFEVAAVNVDEFTFEANSEFF